MTVPGLDVRADWRLVRDRLLDEFPEVSDVLATTMTGTILILHDNATPDEAGRWLNAVSDTLLDRRQRACAHRIGSSTTISGRQRQP